MTLNIRNEKADTLARQLAHIDKSTITEAIISALRETIEKRLQQERPQETAQRILASRGLTFKKKGRPVPQDAYHDLDHDLGA